MKMILTVTMLLMLFFTACTTVKPDTADPGSTVVVSDAGKVIYKADNFGNNEQRLTNIYIIVRNDDMSLRAVLRADYADWLGSKWELSNPTQYTREEDTLSITASDG